jgi:hypothetical protein
MNFIFHIVETNGRQVKTQPGYLNRVYVTVNVKVLKGGDTLVNSNYVGIIN